MATIKALKAKEDAWRKALQDQLDAVFAATELMVEDLHKILAELEALNETIPYEAALVGRREPTEDEIAYGKTLEPEAKKKVKAK